MVNYGQQEPGDEPTKPQVHRAERKYSGHKLETTVNHTFYERHHGGESTKRKHKKEQTHARASNKNSAKP